VHNFVFKKLIPANLETQGQIKPLQAGLGIQFVVNAGLLDHEYRLEGHTVTPASYSPGGTSTIAEPGDPARPV